MSKYKLSRNTRRLIMKNKINIKDWIRLRRIIQDKVNILQNSSYGYEELTTLIWVISLMDLVEDAKGIGDYVSQNLYGEVIKDNNNEK